MKPMVLTSEGPGSTNTRNLDMVTEGCVRSLLFQ
jgi:hypothetical protein